MEEDQTSNSLLNQLQSKLKGGLKPTTTKTTFPDGTVQISSTSSSKITTSEEKSFGFVVDSKPDLTIGQVTPWLFISSQDVPTDKKILDDFKITHVLSLLPGFELPPDVRSIIAYHKTLEIYDEESFSLIDSEIVNQAYSFINEARKNSNDKCKVLVHCNAGISRAPSLIIAYLINCEKLSLQEALDKVKLVRPGMRPNAGFVKQLEDLDKRRK